MPSPFAGMDPFVESQAWQGFHSHFNVMLCDLLIEQLRPRYVVTVETHVYVGGPEETIVRYREPDVHIAPGDAGADRSAGTAAAVLAEPVVCTLPQPEQYRQHYLTLATREGRQVVTVIELLSPYNKQPGDGQRQYLQKRHEILSAHVNLVELDLLRKGLRPPTRERLPEGDYFAFVCRQRDFPQVDVYRWTLRDRLPNVPVPLQDDDPDAVLPLQEAFDLSYDRAGYDYSLNYREPVLPPLGAADAAWVQERLAGRPTAQPTST